MSRDLDVTLAAHIDDQVVYPVRFMNFFFDTGTLRLWTGLGDFTWNSNVYTGSGTIVSMGNVEEGNGLKATNFVLTLSAAPATIIATALTESYQNRNFELYHGQLDAARNLYGEPALIFAGLMDVMEIDEGSEAGTVRLFVEHEAVIIDEPIESRYTDQEQQRRFSGDLAFRFVTALEEKEIIWPGD